ncbi:MAG: hypothetical protein ACJAXY_000146 [Nonlabens sp.]|jgi:hypothetical protein
MYNDLNRFDIYAFCGLVQMQNEMHYNQRIYLSSTHQYDI